MGKDGGAIIRMLVFRQVAVFDGRLELFLREGRGTLRQVIKHRRGVLDGNGVHKAMQGQALFGFRELIEQLVMFLPHLLVQLRISSASPSSTIENEFSMEKFGLLDPPQHGVAQF